jgi:hydrogenase expression/formation protein HypC
MGVPMQVVSANGLVAHCADGAREATVDLALVGPQEPGVWVLVFLGSARSVLPEDEALLIRRALEGLAAAMSGGDLGDAFADLEAREPALPPHLEAARRAGAATG